MVPKRWLAMGLGFLAAACTKGLSTSEIAARVNGEAITRAELQAHVERKLQRLSAHGPPLSPATEASIKQSVLNRLIEDKLVFQQAAALGLEVTAAEVDAKFAEYRRRFATAKAFADYLDRSKNTQADIQADLKRKLLCDRVVERLGGAVTVTDTEVAADYAERQDRFIEAARVKVSRIVLPVESDVSPAERQAVRQRAESLRKKAAAPGADFLSLGREQDRHPAAPIAKEQFWVAKGLLSPAFDQVAFHLEPQAVSQVIELPHGFEIIKVWERRPARQRPLAEVEQTIHASLLARKRSDRRRAVLGRLRRRAQIEPFVSPQAPAPLPGASEASGLTHVRTEGPAAP